jgi:hypothetical protein
VPGIRDELIAAWQVRVRLARGRSGGQRPRSLAIWRAPAASRQERMQRVVALAYEGLRRHTAAASPDASPERDPVLTHLARLLASAPSGSDA